MSMTENEFGIVEGWLREAMEYGEERHNEPYEKAIKALEKVQQFEAIGTIEEFKALKEKNMAKKPTPIDYEKYIGVIENAKFLRGAYWCPNCKHTVMSGAYCSNCGQKLDWE